MILEIHHLPAYRLRLLSGSTVTGTMQVRLLLRVLDSIRMFINEVEKLLMFFADGRRFKSCREC